MNLNDRRLTWPKNVKGACYDFVFVFVLYFLKLSQFWYHRNCHIFLIIIVKFYASDCFALGRKAQKLTGWGVVFYFWISSVNQVVILMTEIVCGAPFIIRCFGSSDGTCDPYGFSYPSWIAFSLRIKYTIRNQRDQQR